MVVGFFEGFGVGFGEGSFCFDGGSGMVVGGFLGADSGAEADLFSVGGRGKSSDVNVSSLVTVPLCFTSGPRSLL